MEKKYPLPRARRQYIVKKRRLIQWLLVPVFLIPFALGWKYHWMGFVVPVVMISGIIVGAIRGRYVCGNFCPRGSFFDRVFSKVSPSKKIPSFFRNPYFRVFMVGFLFTMLVTRLSKDITNPLHWGYTFWFLCFVTTLVAMGLGLLFHERTWCAFCPIGSIASFLGGKKRVMRYQKDKCVSCRLCEKACPMTLSLIDKAKENYIENRDCIQCQECVGRCPKGILALTKPEEVTREVKEESCGVALQTA